MVVKVADSILSPYGLGTEANYMSIKEGKSCLQKYEGKWGLPEPFFAAFIEDGFLEEQCRKLGVGNEYTRLERMAIVVINDALKEIDINLSDDNILFVFATTKGNVHLLDESISMPSDSLQLTKMARKVAQWFGNKTCPIVVSNACISGLQAQIEAERILIAGKAEYVITIASDMLSPFIVSGFQAFKAISDEECRPFDEDRLGLNLGEAAACVIYKRASEIEDNSCWRIESKAVFNDAFHISHPSKTAEGSYLALKTVIEDINPESITMINVHGTATMYNDEMEAVAINRAGMAEVPINSLKGFFGHTMGAAGLVETLITMQSLDNGVILGTKGFCNLGVSRKVNISSHNREAKGMRFIKLISGFGGCNAAVRYSKQ